MQDAIQVRFPVRGNEIGPTGRVTLGGLARYFEWSRWSFFVDERTAELRTAFKGGVARAQTIEVLAPIAYPNEVVIDLFIARVGKSSLDFGHELRAGDGTLVARSRVTIVQLGPNGPEPYPDWLASHVSGREAVTPLALPDGPIADAFSHSWQVRPSDLDQFRHVNQARYVDHADDTRQLAHLAGHDAGFGGEVKKITVAYQRETRAGAVVTAHLARRENGERLFALLGADGQVASLATLVPA